MKKLITLVTLLALVAGSALANTTKQDKKEKKKMNTEIATVAGGCFWCIEAPFDELVGVEKSVSGYSGGHVKNPTYDQVSAKNTGHAEVVQITFDPTVISYQTILEVTLLLNVVAKRSAWAEPTV